MRQNKGKMLLLFFSAIFMLIVVCTNKMYGMAAETYQLQQIDVKEDQIIAYVDGNAEIGQVDCQIGMVPCEDVIVNPMKEMPFEFQTIVLVDNSLSITDENKEKAMELLKVYMESKKENEYVSIAVFGEDIEFLVEKENDSQVLLEALDRIEQNNQDTYLTDILYDLLDTLEEGEYTRFIVVSDGVDNKAIGITKEELTNKLKENAHPVYTLGHIYKQNETELENMFALSRATGGKEFLLDEEEDITAVAEQLVDTDNLLRIQVAVPKDISDGSSQNILFTIGDDYGEHEIRTQINLPFSIREGISEPEPEPQPEPEPEPELEPEPEPEPELEPEPIEEVRGIDGIISVIFVLPVILLVVVVLLLLRKRKDSKREKKEKKAKNKQKEKDNVEKQIPIPTATAISEPDCDMTVVLDRRYLLVMRDVQDPSRIFKYPLDNKVIIGRNIDKVNIAVDYNKTVSGQHCEIYARHNRFYILDHNSSNKTYVDGHEIDKETEISTGSMVRLGEVEFSVEMIPI